MRDNFLIFGQPLIEQPEIDEVVDSLHKAWLGSGPKVARFEADFAAYKNAGHVVAPNATLYKNLAICLSTYSRADTIITGRKNFL